MNKGRAYTTPLGQAIAPKVTLRDIANEAGVSYSFVTKVSSGARPCSPKVARAIEKLLGVSASEFFVRR